MNEIITINQQQIAAKEYQGQRVVTLKDIDLVHNRPEGTARKRFNDNREHFIEGTDYFVRKTDEAKEEFGIAAPNGLMLLTESGYLMLVKSFTDDLAGEVQRALVNNYFRVKTAETNLSQLSPELRLLISLELQQKEQKAAIEDVNRRVDHIGEVISLSPNSWRSDARNLIIGIAHQMGGTEFIKEVQAEVFRLVDERGGVSLSVRLANKRRRMADEGVCKSKRDKVNKLDIIAEDKKLIEIYLAIVKEMAVKNGVQLRKDGENA